MSATAKQSFDEILKFCERSTAEVRCAFGDGDWETMSGPEFLRRFKAETSGRLRIDWVADKAQGADGHSQ
jgi:hypothetical protein